MSGKLVKTANFSYNNIITFEGKRIPFVSKMVIRDALIDAETTMEYGAVSVKKIPASEFDLGQLQWIGLFIFICNGGNLAREYFPQGGPNIRICPLSPAKLSRGKRRADSATIASWSPG